MELICKLKDIYKALYTYERHFAELTGLTINEAALLCCLKHGEKKSANELCEFVGLSNSRVSRIITSSEEKGLITREIGQEDKRQMIFSLSDGGRAKIAQMNDFEIDLQGLINVLNLIAKE